MALDRNEIIILAAELGYFKSKSAEKKTVIAEELVTNFNALNEGETATFDDVLVILNEESDKRSEKNRQRIAARHAKDQREAAKPLSGGQNSPGDHIRDMSGSRVYVITTAQNNTDIDPVFWAALQNYVKRFDARLLIAKTTYNKNGFLQPDVAADPANLWYAPEIKEYLTQGHIKLADDLHFFADANVIPTAKTPLSSFEPVTPAGVSCIIPAVKIALKCTAALAGMNGKVLYSTGAVTKRNYILRKAGAVAQSEHNIGALVVEIDSQGAHTVRQLELMPDASGFYDECVFYHQDGTASYESYPAALQPGDLHAEKMTDENYSKLMELISQYQPANVLAHDVMDFSSRNHHNVKDATFMFAQHVAGNTVEGDLQKVAGLLDDVYSILEGWGGALHVIESNHDLAINTWLKNADFKLDPVNAQVYLRCMLAWYEHIAQNDGETFNMLQFAASEIGESQYADQFNFHETDESVIIAGVEMGCHGHTGINGSRGSPAQFRTLGIAMNTGHTHTPSINGAVYTAGVSAALEMGYNTGPSSWKLAHVLTYPNGQRQIIFM